MGITRVVLQWILQALPQARTGSLVAAAGSSTPGIAGRRFASTPSPAAGGFTYGDGFIFSSPLDLLS